MTYRLLTCVLLMSLTACGKPSTVSLPVGKTDGPAVRSLSSQQLLAVYQDCTRYGQIDDRRVRYTAQYCASVQSAELSSGYTAPGTARVDPTLNRLH